MKKNILNPFSILVIGIALGIISRLLDIYTSNLGNIFSQMAIWILLGVIISIYSKTKKEAMLNIFLFCIGMVAAYYFTAFISNGVYRHNYVFGWLCFACLSPLFAYFTWLSKEKGIFYKWIGLAIVFVSVFSTILFFDRLRIYDYLINGGLIYFLFFKKIDR